MPVYGGKERYTANSDTVAGLATAGSSRLHLLYLDHLPFVDLYRDLRPLEPEVFDRIPKIRPFDHSS